MAICQTQLHRKQIQCWSEYKDCILSSRTIQYKDEGGLQMCVKFSIFVT